MAGGTWGSFQQHFGKFPGKGIPCHVTHRGSVLAARDSYLKTAIENEEYAQKHIQQVQEAPSFTLSQDLRGGSLLMLC